MHLLIGRKKEKKKEDEHITAQKDSYTHKAHLLSIANKGRYNFMIFIYLSSCMNVSIQNKTKLTWIFQCKIETLIDFGSSVYDKRKYK